MTATVRVYKSTDSGAPGLTGQADSLRLLLKACLVDGYGSNAAAGWTMPYTTTNKGVFYMGSGTPQMYLDVDDSGTNEARIVGYETMTAPATGTGPFPTALQVSGGMFMRKSTTTDGTQRPWLMLACERAFYLFVAAGQTIYGASAANDSSMFFGAFPSYKSGDAYNVALNAQTTTGTNNLQLGTQSTTGLSATPGLYIPRAYTQIGTSVNAAKQVPTIFTASNFVIGLNTSVAYPDSVTGAMNLNRVIVTEKDSGGAGPVERGYLPGFWAVMHNLPGVFYDILSGTGDLTGKSFIFAPVYNSTSAGRAAFEYTGSWEL